MAVTKLGIEPLTAWDYTPFEVQLISEQYANRRKDELQIAVTTAYYTEAFARYKRLPKLEKVLKGLEGKEKYKVSKGDLVLKAMAKEKGVII